jgi:hypothetical protein
MHAEDHNMMVVGAHETFMEILALDSFAALAQVTKLKIDQVLDGFLRCLS